MAKSITAIVRDPETGEGMPGQTVKLRIGPAFSADLYTMTDVSGKPGAYEYNGDYDTADYKLWVNGSEDESFGGDNGRPIINIDQILRLAGGTMTGELDMGSNRISHLAASDSDDDAVNKGQVYSKTETDAKYLPLAGGTMTGDIAAGGNKITGLPVPSAADEAETKGNAADTYFPKEGGTLGGDLDMNGNAIDNMPAPVEPEHLMRQLDGDARYILKELEAAAQQIFAQLIFRTTPYLPYQPTSPFHLANVKYVKDQINNYLSNITPTFQQTETLIIIDFNGTQEDNRRYLTVASGLTQANGYAAADRRIVLLIEGSGNDDETLLPDYNLLPESYGAYIDIAGIEQSVVLIADEVDYESSFLGENIISNVTFTKPAEASPTGFTSKILRNVNFTSDDGTGQYDLTDCIIENCSRDNCTVTTNGCIGNILDITNEQEFLFHKLVSEGGAYEISYPNGDIRGKRILGRQGTDAASDEEIALLDGNYHVVTGTTDIKWIRNTGWTDGSEITLDFPGGLTLIHSVIGIDPQAGILTNTGADKTFAAGSLAKFVLTGGGTFWKEI